MVSHRRRRRYLLTAALSARRIFRKWQTFDPRVYGCRINLEHLKGILPDGPFSRYGDVVELKSEKIDDDSVLKGKLALFAKITPTDDLIAMNKKLQKVYTLNGNSAEFRQ